MAIPDKECFLVSDTRSDATNMESVDWNRNVWIVGGSNVVSSALSYSYVAKAVLTVHPIWLGSSPKTSFSEVTKFHFKLKMFNSVPMKI